MNKIFKPKSLEEINENIDKNKIDIGRLLYVSLYLENEFISNFLVQKIKTKHELNKISDECLNSHIILASKNGYYDVVKYLLELGFNVNDTNLLDETPLMYALESKHFDVADLLIKHGADKKDVFGRKAKYIK